MNMMKVLLVMIMVNMIVTIMIIVTMIKLLIISINTASTIWFWTKKTKNNQKIFYSKISSTDTQTGIHRRHAYQNKYINYVRTTHRNRPVQSE